MREFKEITSRENSLIKLISALQSSSKARRENGLFVLEGLRICSDAFDNGIGFDKLIVSKTAFEKYRGSVDEFSENADECFLIPDSLFQKISDTSSPQGICALCRPSAIGENNIDKNGRYVALENLADPSNLGAISRTAEALGASGLILSPGCCDPYSPKALRASMGTLLRIPVIIADDFPAALKRAGLHTFACVVDSGAFPVTSAEFADGCAVIIGNEANGITDETKSFSDSLITIPMRGKAESLNAAAAAAIAVWEMLR